MLFRSLWTALLGVCLAAALGCSQQWLYRKRYHAPLIPTGRIPIAIVRSAVAGLLAGVCGQLLYSLLEVSPWPVPDAIAQGLGWALLGAILGSRLAQSIPNLPKLAAFVAGIVGGLLGCYGFVSMMNSGSDGIGRVAAAACLGLLIGLMIRLILEPDEEIEAIGASEVLLHPMRLRPHRARTAGTIRPPGKF